MSLAVGTVGALTFGVDGASAQELNIRGHCAGAVIAGLGPACNDNSGGAARAAGGNGGDGGLFTIVHDVGTAEADASNLIIANDITGDEAVDIFAPGSSPQVGNTGGNGNISDSSGGPGGNARANGGNGGDITNPFS
jgi:hypothetical protein